MEVAAKEVSCTANVKLFFSAGGVLSEVNAWSLSIHVPRINPQLTVEFDPLYTLNNKGFFHCSIEYLEEDHPTWDT